MGRDEEGHEGHDEGGDWHGGDDEGGGQGHVCDGGEGDDDGQVEDEKAGIKGGPMEKSLWGCRDEYCKRSNRKNLRTVVVTLDYSLTYNFCNKKI